MPKWTFIVVIFIPLIFLPACSLDVMPVHYSVLRSAKEALMPLKRGVSAPGAFKTVLSFNQKGGFLFDPTELSVTRDGLRTKNPSRDGALVQTTRGVSYVAIDSFEEVAGPGNQGVVKYQFSDDGARWFYFTEGKWHAAGPYATQANRASEVAVAIRDFHSQVGVGSLKIKAFLIAPNSREQVLLKELVIQGIAPKMDGWN